VVDRRVNAAIAYLPDMDGALFGTKLSYTIDYDTPNCNSDPVATAADEKYCRLRHLDSYPDDLSKNNFKKMKDKVVTTTIDSTKKIYLTTFGWDDHNHSYTDRCNIDSASFST